MACFSYLLSSYPYFFVINDLVIFTRCLIYRFGNKLTSKWRYLFYGFLCYLIIFFCDYY